MEKRYREDDMEIDLLELLFEFKKRAWVIILAAVLGCLGAGAYSRLILTPVYTSTAMVYVLSKETTLTSLADLQIGSQLTKDYSVMITSRPVLEQVIKNQDTHIESSGYQNTEHDCIRYRSGEGQGHCRRGGQCFL